MSVILIHPPEDVIRNFLIAIGGIVSVPNSKQAPLYGDWPVFTSNEPDTPDNVVTIYGTPGIINGREHPTGEIQEQYGIQVRVRSVGGPTESSYVVGNRKIYQLCKSLDQGRLTGPGNLFGAANQVYIGAATYIIHSANRTGGVLYLGNDRGNRERDLFTVNYTVAITQN